MSPANRHPKAIVFHVALIVGLLLMHYWLAPPLLLTALLLLAAAYGPGSPSGARQTTARRLPIRRRRSVS